MKRLFTAFLIVIAVTPNINAKSLIVYFSRTGNARTIATEIQKATGADLLQAEPTMAYPSDYNTMLTVGQNEISAIDNKGEYPSIKTLIDNLDDYNTIFVCTPLWWSRMSTPMQSFLHKYSDKWSGKTIYLAVTSYSSGISSVVADAKRLCVNSNFQDNSLWIREPEINKTPSLVAAWIAANKIPTGINEISKDNASDTNIYNLQGMKVTNSNQPGIYIIKGKKVIR
jgi:flavodoxin